MTDKKELEDRLEELEQELKKVKSDTEDNRRSSDYGKSHEPPFSILDPYSWF